MTRRCAVHAERGRPGMALVAVVGWTDRGQVVSREVLVCSGSIAVSRIRGCGCCVLAVKTVQGEDRRKFVHGYDKCVRHIVHAVASVGLGSSGS